ncbi:hypothetical protein [Streptomyces capuensis]|uniref:hypothetical protein n=1 Tax=Streptomyces capuensis TaxID=1464056 RepID=UPI0004C22EE8|nr:hypothetical protein [Streptomyces capuensis]
MADEPSLGELGRLIQLMRSDIRDDLSSINERLGKVVLSEVYVVEKSGIDRRINDIVKVVEAMQAQRAADAERITQTRRWLVASVIIPMLGMVLPLVLFLASSKT